MTNKIVDKGFRPPRIMPDHYFLGAEMVPEIVLQPDGQWLEFLPTKEKQLNDNFDTYGCTVFGTLNAGIEILHKRIFGIEENYSDRFLYIVSETFPPAGNDPHVVAEALRNSGAVREIDLPFDANCDTLEKYISLGEDGPAMLKLAEQFKEQFTFMHDWVFATSLPLFLKQQKLKYALTLSPVGISVRAWQRRKNGLYFKEAGEIDTHWCVLIGYIEGEKWFIFDSYPDAGESYIKELEWDYDFAFAKRYYLAKKTADAKPIQTPTQEKKESFWTRFINWLRNIFNK